MAPNLLSKEDGFHRRIKGDLIMKMRIKDSMTEVADSGDSQFEIKRRTGEMHLLIVAINPESLMKTKSATFHFSNKEKGLEVFDDLVTTAGSVDYLGST